MVAGNDEDDESPNVASATSQSSSVSVREGIGAVLEGAPEKTYEVMAMGGPLLVLRLGLIVWVEEEAGGGGSELRGERVRGSVGPRS